MNTACCRVWVALAILVLVSACRPATDPKGPGLEAGEAGDDLGELPPGLARHSMAPASDDAEAIGGDADDEQLGDGALADEARLRSGTIARSSLDAVLDSGPGRFLGGFDLAPHFRDQHFRGWKIVGFRGQMPGLDDVDLRPGDVVLLVNGRPIVRPRHLQALWTSLRVANAIVVRAERDEQPFELRFDVIDTARPAVP
ncbi:hypothetical protein [Haliangium ochraceum]|uniref:PDZ domain-containing protein n=1 Tax=Haliangium ochraceum (strain DSM 14365 / JCM 11303 / SMP-2) TaxID=502025 RepID=D0LII2_HALO1|nr:hypothetical protein [Haliangium ochraceum]ACY18338.1 hypothetical protein Hoch_5863 [Haliangium ochraceum DSM 14365]